MIREELLALADELEGMNCRTCPADGTKDCRDLPCEEAVARAAARRIREIAEHDACEEAATTVSAYDLLPEEDLKAIEWVREHGVLGEVEKRLMPDGMEWLLDVWPRLSNGEYCKFGDWWKAGEYGEREPQQLSRLAFFTPEKLREWRQDEGENFGYEWDCMRPSDTTYRPDKVEPPAPKVLDADGVEIRVGDTVCGTRDMELMKVVDTDSHEFGFKRIKCEKEGDGFWFYCQDELTHKLPVLAADGKPLRVWETVYKVGGDGTAYVFDGMSDYVDGLAMLHHDGKPYVGTGIRVDQLTHERPVLDADGVPIKEGDTVYLLPGEWCDRFPCLWFYGGEELNVIDLNPKYGEIGSIKCCKAGKMTSLCYPQSSQLTHTKPEIDTWERIKEDAGKDRCSYFGVKYQDCGRCTQLFTLCSINKSRDLVRRCRALVEKENRNE